MRKSQNPPTTNVLVPVRDTSKTRDYSPEQQAAHPFALRFSECGSDSHSIIAAGQAAEILYVRGIEINKRVIERLENCKLIVSGSVGLDNIDVESASRQGIAVVNVPDLFTQEVAEHAVAQILSSYKRLASLDRLLRGGHWADGHQLSSSLPPLSNATLGLVGFGRIAQAVARMMSVFGSRLIASDPYVSTSVFSSFGVESVEMDALAARADIVSIHVPSSLETDGLIGRQFFSLMKPNAILVNTGRGSTIDEAALFTSINDKLISGAALDVFVSEPLAHDSPLLSLPNVSVTPHVASITSAFEPKRKSRIGDEIRVFLSGARPKGCVNWEAMH